MACLRASWRTSLPVAQQPRNPQPESIARNPYDIGLHTVRPQPARQPEAVTPGLIGHDNALKRPARSCGFVPPTLEKPQQRIPIRLDLLQRLAGNPRHDPCHEPACLAHLDHHKQGAILLKCSKRSAQVVRLWHGAPRRFCPATIVPVLSPLPIASTRPSFSRLSTSGRSSTSHSPTSISRRLLISSTS